ncbi:hypothetical protein [Janthinobacterium lividum]|nr:hypothetical protein [Janthinobacterium lividum]
MAQLVHQFLQDEERSRNLVAAVGTSAGVILLTLSILNTFLFR